MAMKTPFLETFENHQYYFNREVSWLEFNARVLEEASDAANPILERLKFHSIFASNLDEFFMIRVANLKDQIKEGFQKPDNKSGMTPKEQLGAISVRTHSLVQRQYHELTSVLLPELKKEGIEFLKAGELNEEQLTHVRSVFDQQVFPVLTPMAVDYSRPFPMLMNKTLNLAVQLNRRQRYNKEIELFAVVRVPSVLPRFIRLPSPNGSSHFIFLEDVLRLHADQLFPGYDLVTVHPFRITRNAILPLNEEDAEDLLEEIEKELIHRRMGSAVRLEIEAGTSEFIKDFLKESLDIETEDIYQLNGPLDLTFLMPFSCIEGYDRLRREPWFPQPPKDLLGEENIFKAIARKDILLHHPYESFDPVVHFIRAAAEDPCVLAIKQTLYRMSGNSRLAEALAKAAVNGKQVTVLVELKARFDEENNINWAKILEDSGCHVIYGLGGLKTHGKISMVVRQEGKGIKRYIHLSTGNYNEKTARLYTDLGMFTSREEIGEDATLFFNHLSGYSVTPALNELVMAPSDMRKHFLSLIENEAKKSTPTAPGHIVAKMNSLTDKEIIKALYAASSAGVKIDLIVRGICCLRPGLKGVSENVRVISIVGQFLEHSRIYYFQNGGDEFIYLASADWMTRNMERRVELLFPVRDVCIRDRIKEILHIYITDNVKVRELQTDGSYKRVDSSAAPPLESQRYFMDQACKAVQNREWKSVSLMND